MPKAQSRKKKRPKRVVALPDLEHVKTAVLNSVTSTSDQRTYDHRFAVLRDGCGRAHARRPQHGVRKKIRITETMARSSRYLTAAEVADLAASLSLTCRIIPVWPGFRRTSAKWRARVRRRRIAQSPIVMLAKP